MNKTLTLGSLFSGSGGFELGGLMCGIEPVWASEIEPFPIRVTTKRLPQVRHLGDIKKIDGSKIPPVDIITAGFPCTDVSCAGRRAGLHAERTGLFFEAIRVIREMLEATNGDFPKFLCFENVPGLLSSNKGKDFCEVMDEIASLGFISDANILDAADFGVAQRRKRVFIVSVNRKYYDHDTFADAPKVRDKRMEKAMELWGGENIYGISSRPYTPIKQRLTEILQSDVDIKYYLSVAACLGIIRRAEARGKKLPELLRIALESQAGLIPSQSTDEDAPIMFKPGATSRLGGHYWKDGEPVGTLLAHMGDNQATVAIPINTQVATRHNALGEGTGFGVGEDGDPAYTLQSARPHAVAVENHPADSRVKLDDSGTVQTLTGRMGTGGGNVPLVMNERQYALTVGEDVANTLTGTDYKGTQCVFEPVTMKIRSGCEGGGKGALVQDNLSATLSCNNDQTLFEPKTYGICSQNSNSMKSSNPDSGIYEMEQSRTLDTGGCAGNGGQVVVFDGKQVTSKDNRSNPQPGDPCHTLSSGSADSAVICLEGNGSRPSHRGSGISEDDVSFTLNTVEKHSVAYGIDRAAFNQGKNALYKPQFTEEGVTTLTSRGPSAVCSQYIVRRLIPGECALLQGFDFDFCEGLETPEPTEDDIAFWAEVFETHRIIMGTSKKPKSRNQIIKWLKNPHSDSAEYKLWGNGVALPCVVFVLGGIVEASESLRLV